tara:strand:+ start:33 stop:1013 length:981 start_codon:yes stop_codon:yes gene_type:complete
MMALTPGAADPEDKTIEIVGAGPAGLVCAIVLAKANRRVVVREWHEDVGHRFRDHFQRLENWTADGNVPDELAEAGVAADFDHFGVTDGVVFDSRATAHRVHGSQPLFYLLRRGNATGTLDRALLDRARAAGVEVRFNDRVKRTAGNMILAGRPRRADIIAVGYVFDTTMADGAWLAFGAEIASKGYAYLLVHQGRGAVASYMFSGFHDQAEYLAATVSYFERHAGLQMQRPRGFGGFGNVRLPRTAMQGRNPVIGEHAGLAGSTTWSESWDRTTRTTPWARPTGCHCLCACCCRSPDFTIATLCRIAVAATTTAIVSGPSTARMK